MFEKVSIYHPDKIADRIAGAIVDLAYKKQPDPKIAVEVLIGHGKCHIISETSIHISKKAIKSLVYPITGKMAIDYKEVAQDSHLAANQADCLKCGDNGIFKAVPVTKEEQTLTKIAKILEKNCPADGKYILAKNKLIICQSNATEADIKAELFKFSDLKKYKESVVINPLGYWTGGTDVDTGCTNRKLGSDLAGSITGGGINGKDLSKADVSVTIYCWLMAQALQKEITAYCSIGAKKVIVNGEPISFSKIVTIAKDYIAEIGGFEELSKYGLIRFIG